MTGTPGRPGQRLTLADGRRLGYDDHGPRDGAPIFYFHGAPSSRLDLRMFAGSSKLTGQSPVPGLFGAPELWGP